MRFVYFSESTMDEYEKLIKQDMHNGAYAVIFQNLNRLDTEEIKEIFSKFGNVISVQVTGNETGYRFVRFESYNDAQKAVDGIKNHSTIKLLPHRKKNKNNEENFNTGSKSKYSTNRRTDNGYNSKMNEENCNTGSKSKNNMNRKTDNGYDSKMNEENYNTGSKSKNNTNCKTDNEFDSKMNEENYNSGQESKNNINYKTDNGIDLKMRHNGFNQENRYKNDSENTTIKKPLQKSSRFNKNKSCSSSVNTSYDSSKSVCSEELNNVYEDEIPDLVSSNGKIPIKKNTSRKIIIDAQAVIVGNIHPKIGPSYILHLFDQFEPLAITEMQSIPSSGIRYCHVYFKTVEESLCVENKFDKFDLLGTKLVVLQANKLVKEATF